MYKAVISFMCAFMLMSLTACGIKNEPDTANRESPLPESNSAVQPEAPSASQPTIDVEETEKETSITLSKKFLDAVWGHEESFDVEDYAKELEEREMVDKAYVNADGSVTFTISTEKHRQLMARLRKELLDTENGMLECVERIEANEDCTKVSLYVDREKYDDGFNGPVALLQKQIESVIYQAFNGTLEAPVVLEVLDAETNEVIKTMDAWPLGDDWQP